MPNLYQMVREPQRRCVTLTLVLIALVGAAFCLNAKARAEGEAKRTNRAEADALFTNGLLHVLKIEVSKQGMRWLREDPRRYVPATLREDSTLLTNVMVRLKGGAGSFRGVDDKPGFTVDLDRANGRFHGLRKFHLNNSVQDFTYLSEWTCSELFRQAGVPAGRVAHAVVELNGRRLGLYVLLESINSDFLAQYFRQAHGNVYSLSANADINGGLEQMGGREDTHGAELRVLAAAAGERNPDRLRLRLAQALDVRRFLSFMALEVILDHWDGYTFNVKNYEVYHDPENGKVVFMPHDMDQVLRNEQAPIIPSPQGMVAQAVLREPFTRLRYQERFREISTTYFVAPVLIRRIDERVARLAPQLRRYDPRLAQELTVYTADLKARIVQRAQALAARLSLPLGPRR